MRNNSYAPHYAISRYSIREFKTGADPFMVAMIIIIIIRSKSELIVCLENLEAGNVFVARHGFKMCTGAHYIGGYIGDNMSKHDCMR